MIDRDDPKYQELVKWSDPVIAQNKAYRLFGREYGELSISQRKDKKYSILDPYTKQRVSFGQMGFEDFTKHKSRLRRRNYLARAEHIKGDWKDDPFSPNWLSIHVLW